MMKRAITILVVLLGIFAIIQFIRPDRTNPPSDAAMSISQRLPVPDPVRMILERSCFDCHSNQTRWPWYSNVAPASWLVADDVKEGRGHLNFSEWGTYNRGKQIARLETMISLLEKDAMPPKNYLLLHRDAVLNEREKDLLSDWAGQMSDSLSSLTK
jgi:hypothetical protein